MAKKKKDIDKVIKQPDIVIRTISAGYEWLKKNLKQCIIVASVVVILACAAFGYKIYLDRKDEEIQRLFAEGMKYYREYTITGKDEALNKAEELFKKVSSEAGGNIKALSKLYIGRISYIKGKMDDAIKLYKDAQAETDAEAIKMLSKKALDVIEKK
ncbi:MAG: hypothetical protein N2596_06310 [Syntrophorhabdaceae bacterium]|nr:hypothetical protein [Syntrophorhabdaceae bacterium]